MKPLPTITSEDRFQIADALYRFAAGQDVDDRKLLESAFSTDAVVDFTHPASVFGVGLPPFEGRDSIVETVWSSTESLITTHTITNIRIVEGSEDRARVEALIEAYHQTRVKNAAVLLLKNHIDVELVKEALEWRIQRMVFRNIWHEGAREVLFPDAVGR